MLFTVSLQSALYYLFIFLAQSLPYPLFVKSPDVRVLLLLTCSIIFLGSMMSGIVLGWRYWPVIVLYLAGTTLALLILIAILMTTGAFFSGIERNVLIQDINNTLHSILKEETIPAAIWGSIGGISGASLRLLLKQKTGIARLHFRFLFHISASVLITIVVFGVVSYSPINFLSWGAPIFFVGAIVSLIVPAKGIILAGASQALFGLAVVTWMCITARGEGTMLILPTLFIGVPISICFGFIGGLYGRYLRNHFLVYQLPKFQ